MLLPMPTPPPWWTETQLAPEAVLSRALRIGQSAMASLPSRMASVSLYGEATEPVSRWSRPMTRGAARVPSATILLKRRPRRGRSPPADQQIRAGRPCGEGHPAERPLALAEEGADIGGHEPGVAERGAVAILPGQAAQVVAVVEDLRAGLLETDHGFTMAHGGGAGAVDVLARRAAAQLCRRGHVVAGGDVAVERVVGRRLVRYHAGDKAQREEARVDLGGIALEADRQRPALGGRLAYLLQGVVEVARGAVEVPVRDAPLDARGVDLDAEGHAAEHGHGQGLRSAHAAEPGGQHDLALQGAVETRGVSGAT